MGLWPRQQCLPAWGRDLTPLGSETHTLHSQPSGTSFLCPPFSLLISLSSFLNLLSEGRKKEFLSVPLPKEIKIYKSLETGRKSGGKS